MSEDRTGTQNTAAPESLTERQRTILQVIKASVTSRGYPPSIREIGDAVGLTSTSSVHHQLRTLERKGYLRRDPHRTRAVDVRGPEDGAADDEVDLKLGMAMGSRSNLADPVPHHASIESSPNSEVVDHRKKR